MIYINNNTEVQTIYIPRQEELPYNHNGGGDYNEGYSDGYSDGYQSGTTHQQSLLSSGTFESNGTYTNQNGWNEVVVDVECDCSEAYASGVTDGFSSGYTSGSTDGYNSGYTSGVTYQKSLLTSTAITRNSKVTNENGFSSVTVNVPIPKIQDGISTAITENGTTIINPSSYGISYAHGGDSVSITANNYTMGQTTYIGYIQDDFDESKGYIDVYWYGSGIGYDDTDWDGETIYDSYSGNNIMKIEIRGSGIDLGFYGDGDTGGTYSGISLVEVNVNVPTSTSGHTDQELDDAYNSGRTDVISTFTATTITTNGTYGSSANPFSSVTVNVSGGGYGEDDLDAAYESGFSSCLSSLTVTAITENGQYNGAFSTINVNVPTSGSQSALGTATFTENGTYSATTDGIDGYSVVNVNVGDNPYGELYGLYYEDASVYLGYGTYHFKTYILPTSDVLISGHTSTGGRGGTSINIIMNCSIGESTTNMSINYNNEESGGITVNNRGLDNFYQLIVQPKVDIYGGSVIFGNGADYFDDVTKASAAAGVGVTISGSSFYILNYYECGYHAAIDDDGNAYFKFGNMKMYPSVGNCYPLYRKKVNGVYKYFVIKAQTAE